MIYLRRYSSPNIFPSKPFRFHALSPSGEERGYVEVVEIEGCFLKILHTVVAPPFRGQGVGWELLCKSVDYTRSKEMKLLSACDYAAKLISRDPLASDLAATAQDIHHYLDPKKRPAVDKPFVERVLGIKPGSYASDDLVLPLSMPDLRCQEQVLGPFSQPLLNELISHPIHDLRMLAVIALKEQFVRSKAMADKERLHDYYVQHLRGINNWDLVDLSAPHLIGSYAYLKGMGYEEIYSMALSSDLWIKRIGIVSTLGLIRQGILDPTIRVVEANLSHQHHLIHKAMGWMLREVGKRDESRMLNFLELTVAKMPRTTLRYAIERLDTDTRRSLLAL